MGRKRINPSDKPSEANILNAIVDYLERFRILYIRVNPTSPILDSYRIMEIFRELTDGGIGSVEALKRIRAAIFRPIRESQKGAPDLIVYPGGGETLHVEVKSSRGKLNPEQLLWLTRSHKAGISYYVVKSIDEFLFVMKEVERLGKRMSGGR